MLKISVKIINEDSSQMGTLIFKRAQFGPRAFGNEVAGEAEVIAEMLRKIADDLIAMFTPPPNDTPPAHPHPRPHKPIPPSGSLPPPPQQRSPWPSSEATDTAVSAVAIPINRTLRPLPEINE